MFQTLHTVCRLVFILIELIWCVALCRLTRLLPSQIDFERIPRRAERRDGAETCRGPADENMSSVNYGPLQPHWSRSAQQWNVSHGKSVAHKNIKCFNKDSTQRRHTPGEPRRRAEILPLTWLPPLLPSKILQTLEVAEKTISCWRGPEHWDSFTHTFI